MTDEIRTASPGDTTGVSAGPAYRSLAALRDAHSALRRSTSKSSGPSGSAGRKQQIRSFLIAASGAGAFISEARERRVAQGILDFWSAELASSLTGQSDFGSTLLVPYDTTLAAQGGDQPPAAAPASKVDQRALVRLSALARQWRDSDRQPGYLLTGEAVEEATSFKGRDSNLDEFIRASEQAVEERNKSRARRRQAIAVAALVLAAFGSSIWYFELALRGVDRLTTQYVSDHGKDDKDWLGALITPSRALWTLGLIQPWRPPYDLSGTPTLANIKLSGLTLYAPNFSGVEFNNVQLPGAKLPAASFSSSYLGFDGGGGIDFGGATLQRAQFRAAHIRSTSFAGADLYRAVFDRALLCDVDFAGANLRDASFWAATLNDKTKEKLKKAAWWLAVGWTWSEIREHQDPAGLSEDDRSKLKNSTGFKDDIQRPIDAFQRSYADTLERAYALGDLAWTYAVWGINIVGPNGKDTSASAACSAGGLPTNARDAAEQAVCIVRKLNGTGEKGDDQRALLSNLQDTLAYVHMQNNEMPEALQMYDQIARDDPKSAKGRETSFRYAIAQYVAGQDKDAAIRMFKNSVEVLRYQPTHELQTLKDYIFPVKEFVDVLQTSADNLWPSIKEASTNDEPACPASVQ